MKTDDQTFASFTHMLRRRARPAAVTAMAILLGMMAFTFSIPPVYESSASLLIEAPQVAPETVGATGPQEYVEQRLQRTRQLVLTTDNVNALIKRHKLLQEDGQALSPGDQAVAFNSNVVITPQVTGVVDPRSMRDADLTYAFDVTFKASDPEVAAAVANDLAQLFVTSGAERAKADATRSIAFLSGEAERLQADLREREARLAEFRQTHFGALPENREQTLAMASDLERDLARADDDLRAVRARKDLLEAQLRDTPRDRAVIDETGQEVLAGANRLEAAQRELIAALAKYSEDHPDVRRLRREIASLSAQTATGSAAAPTNPAYLQLQTQINAADVEIRQLTSRRYEIASARTRAQAAVFKSPEYEKQYTDLVRDYELIKEQYQQMRQKQASAEITAKAARADAGETYMLINPAQVPTRPAEPDRVALMFLGLVLALSGGLGIVSLLNAIDTTIRGSADIAQIAGATPLGSIPELHTTAEIRTRRLRDAGITAGMLTAVVVVIAVIAF
jgi:polysaccharide chain length determinant protein (PEP-CTERM system associated)